MINLLISIMLVALSGDLLYLYYDGAWYDPIALIETIEVIALYILGFIGIVGIIQNTRRLARKLRWF